MSSGCCEIPQLEKRPTDQENAQKKSLSLRITGMNCQGCAGRVRNALLATFGVTAVEMDLARGLAEVVYNPTLSTPAGLIEAVRSAGGDGRHEYTARLLAG